MERLFSAYKGPGPYVFVCYAHDDAEVVYPEIVRLQDSGFHVWYDEGISPGTEWSKELAEHIEGCAAFLYFVTPKSVEREHCRREVSFALEQQCSVLAVHLTETEVPSALKLSLSNRQAILRYELSASRYQEKLDTALAHAAVGRSTDVEKEASTLQVGEWLVDAGSGKLTRGETETHLPPQTMSVLIYLARHPHEVVSTDELLKNVWQGRFTGDDSVYQHIGRIRKTLGDSTKEHRYIETIPRRGYRMVANVGLGGSQDEDQSAGQVAAGQAESPETKSSLAPHQRALGITVSASRSPRWPLFAVGFVAIALVVAAGIWWTQQGAPPAPEPAADTTTTLSIAVLPFVNMSNDPDQEYFSDGITEDILNELARNTSLIVRPRSSAFALKGTNLDLQAMGQRLNVTHILEGSVRRAGERLRVTVQLSEVDGNRAIWSDRYDRELTDVFAVQDEITEDVVNSLGARFERRTSPRRFVSNESYEVFLRGRSHLNRGEYEAAHWLKVATDLDPTNVDAWASRATVQSYRMFTERLPTSEENLGELFEFTGQALAIDPNHSSALSTNALWRFIVHRDYRASIEQLIEVVRENPNDTDAHLHLAFCLRGVRQYPMAERVVLRAQEIDPLSILTIVTLLDIFIVAGDIEKARRFIDAYYERHSGLNSAVEQFVFHLALSEGNLTAMEASLGSLVGHPSYPVNLALAAYLQGDHGTVNEILQTYATSSQFISHVDRSRLALIQGRFDAALDFWREGLRTHEGAAVMYVAGFDSWRRTFPEFYAHPGYRQMLVDFGLDPDSLSKIRVPQLPF